MDIATPVPQASIRRDASPVTPERVALELGRRALAAYQAHQQKFAGALGWGKKAYAVATVHAGEVAAFLGGP